MASLESDRRNDELPTRLPSILQVLNFTVFQLLKLVLFAFIPAQAGIYCTDTDLHSCFGRNDKLPYIAINETATAIIVATTLLSFSSYQLLATWQGPTP